MQNLHYHLYRTTFSPLISGETDEYHSKILPFETYLVCKHAVFLEKK